MSAAVHAGGLVVGAFARDNTRDVLCGFVYGFPTYENSFEGDSVGLHSDMMAVLPHYRGLGIGQRLKRFQREWCLERSLNWITWTFDPLQAKNAKLNVAHLGATASQYIVNPYGVLGGTLNSALPSDRLVARWDLLREGELEPPSPQRPLENTPRTYALNADTLTPNIVDEPRLYVATPEDINTLRTADPDKASAWRLAQREVFLALLARGYRVTRFVEGHYVLTR